MTDTNLFGQEPWTRRGEDDGRLRALEARLATVEAALSNVDVLNTDTAEDPATTPYKLQAGSSVVSFSAGNGTLNFPSSFATACLTLVVSSGDAGSRNDIIITGEDGGLFAGQAALVAIASDTLAAITGNVRVNFLALGY